MPDVQVIPVLDLMHAQVVRGVGGRRDEYRPIRSLLCEDARPASVGAALVSLGFRRAYLADLDAIQGGHRSHGDTWSPAWSTYETLLGLGLDLWVDAGLRTSAEARELARFSVGGRPLAGIVAGLESLDGPEALLAMCRLLGPRLVFSLDLKAGVPLAPSPAWRGLGAEHIAAIALRSGVARMIVLDLANVGMDAGTSTLALCRAIRCRAPALELVAGGGVRGSDDLTALARAGCNAALVASALHDGRLDAGACARRSS